MFFYCVRSIVRKMVYSLRLDSLACRLGFFSPKVIRYIDGGLASQMVMFAKGYVEAKRRKLPLFLEIEWFENNGCDIQGVKNRHWLLFDVFPEIQRRYKDSTLKESEISIWFRRFFSDEYSNHGLLSFGPCRDIPRSVYLRRYRAEGVQWFVSELKDLRELFDFSLKLTEEEKSFFESIKNTNSCALHIRKGDFVGSIHDVCSDAYYLAAIDKMLDLCPDSVFYVFTNDENYARKLLNDMNCKLQFLSNRSEGNPSVDLWLMMQCKHAIISNSGFSLIAALLTYAEEKRVIMPRYWLNGEYRERTECINQLPGWYCIEP